MYHQTQLTPLLITAPYNRIGISGLLQSRSVKLTPSRLLQPHKVATLRVVQFFIVLVIAAILSYSIIPHSLH